MNCVLRIFGTIAASFAIVAASGGQETGYKVPMNHIHHGDVTVVGAGTLGISEHGLVWTENSRLELARKDEGATIRAESSHSFSASCGEIKDAELHFPKLHGAQYWAGHENVIKVHTLDREYEFQSVSGYSAIIILDRIRMTCRLGDPVLESSKSQFAKKSDSPNGGLQTPSQEDPMFDVVYDGGGGRGVLFIKRAGVTFEQVVVPQPAAPKMSWRGAKVSEITRVRPVSLPCSNLMDITVRGSATNGFFVKGSNPELDIHDGLVTHKFFLGANIYAQAVKQAIADYCSRN
jgi:hypothetical protein